MKKIIQLSLLLLLIIISIIFYNTYFGLSEKNKIISNKEDIIRDSNETSFKSDDQNNLIKNLRYNVNLDNNREYIIYSELSELRYENNVEIVKMQKVFGVFVDNTNLPINITSDTAVYNRTSSNTLFEKNVRIEYMDNLIMSDKLDLNFEKNIVSIYDNVVYEGIEGKMIADNIVVNLISKKIEIYMHNNLNKVEITMKQ